MKLHLLFSLKNDKRFKKLFVSYLKTMLIPISIPFIVLLLIFSGVYDYYYTEEIEQLASISAIKSNEKISVLANEIDAFFYSVIKEEYIAKFLDSDNPTPKTINNQENYYKVSNEVNNFKSSYDLIHSIFIYSIKSDYVFSTQGSGYLSDHPAKDFVNSCIKETDTNTNQKYSILIDKETGLPEKCISLIYMINTKQYNEPDGIMIINLSSKYMAEYIENDYISEQISILSNDGEVLYSLGESDVEEFVLFYKKNIDEISRVDFLTEKIKNNISCYLYNPDLGMTAVIGVPTDALNIRMFIYIAAGIMVIILLMLAVILTSSYLSTSIHEISKDMISNIGISETLEDNQSGGTRYLSGKLLTIMKNDDYIKGEIANKVYYLKQTHALALQSQINPHFLFNTLQLVNLMTMRITGGDNESSKILTLLADLLNYVFHSDDYLVPLEMELEYAKKYIEIEQIKRNNSFELDVNVDESLLKYMTIKFTLQPILENCIIHGFKNNNEANKKIKLSVSSKDDNLFIVIENNGNKIDKDRANEINKKLERVSEKIDSSNIGMSNVNSRIKLISGQQYGVKIIQLDNWTRVEIIQPLIYE